MRVITVRNVPESLYAEISRQAERERRSLQQQVLVMLERSHGLSLPDPPLDVAARIRERLAGRPHTDTVEAVRAERSR